MMRIMRRFFADSEYHKEDDVNGVDNEDDDDEDDVQRCRRRVGRARLVLTTSHILYQSCTKILSNAYLSNDDDSNIFHR